MHTEGITDLHGLASDEELEKAKLQGSFRLDIFDDQLDAAFAELVEPDLHRPFDVSSWMRELGSSVTLVFNVGREPYIGLIRSHSIRLLCQALTHPPRPRPASATASRRCGGGWRSCPVDY